MMITVFEVLKSDIPEADIYHSVSTGYAGLIGALGKYYHKNSKFILTEHGIYTRERVYLELLIPILMKCLLYFRKIRNYK